MGTKLRFGIIVTALEVQFWFPVWLLFLLDRGFTIGQAALADAVSVSYTHLTLPTIAAECRSRWSPYH